MGYANHNDIKLDDRFRSCPMRKENNEILWNINVNERHEWKTKMTIIGTNVQNDIQMNQTRSYQRTKLTLS